MATRVKHLPMIHARHFEFALNHLSAIAARQGGTIGKAAHAFLERNRELHLSVIDSAKALNQRNFGIVVHSPLDLEIVESAIVEWVADLEWTKAGGTMIADAKELVRVYDLIEWHDPLNCECQNG